MNTSTDRNAAKLRRSGPSRVFAALALPTVAALATVATLALVVTPAIAQVATRLADTRPGDFGFPLNLTRSGNYVYFRAYDPVNGTRLWQTDGTVAGTLPFHDPQPSGASGDVDFLSDVDGTLFFSQSDGVAPLSLWKTDGTEAGTVFVSDNAPNYNNYPFPARTVGWNGKLYFFREVPGHSEFWKSDGTTAGTVKIADVGGSNLTVLAGRLYWSGGASGSLWTSDGTEAGTYELLDTFQVDSSATCPPPPSPFYPSWWCLSFPAIDHWIAEANGLVYVAVTENVGTALNVALWTTNGTVAGTHRVRKVSDHNFDMANVGGTLYLTGEEPATGNELWTSDGTLAGTVLFDDIVPGSGSSSPHHFTAAGGILWFLTSSAPPHELWTSDGTVGGTTLVGPLPTDYYTNQLGLYWNDANQRVAVGTKLFFTSHSACGTVELWMSEGASTGIRRPRYLAGGADIDRPQVLPNGKLIFVGHDEAGDEIWSYDGGTPPPDTCDDGVMDAGEDCDLGSSNGQFGSCCQCTCRLSPAGTECAASTGGCDLPEVCDGMSDMCPVPVVSACGNGILESGEQCDEGAANGEDTSCCSCDCTTLGSATVCRSSTGTCDPAETCTGTSGVCPADIGDDDVDFDQICDAGDACINNRSPGFGAFRRPKLSLNNIKGEGRFESDVFMPNAPTIDPPSNGARLLISNEDDSESIVDVTIPAGAYDPLTRTGWKTSGGGKGWIYYNRDGYDGVTKFSILKVDKPWNMKVRVLMKNRTFFDSSMTGIPHPLHLVLVIDSPIASTGQCADIPYNLYQCEADQTNQVVKCE